MSNIYCLVRSKWFILVFLSFQKHLTLIQNLLKNFVKYTIQSDVMRAVDLKIPEVMTAATKTHLNFQVGRIFQLSKYIIPTDHK